MRKPLVIGLVGGIASGKSTLGTMLSARGAVVLEADRMAHSALADDDIRSQLVARWGREILDAKGRVDRRAVADRVFGDDESVRVERQFLEGILHPRVRAEVEREVACAARARAPAVVIDAPLLLEAGWGDLCDELLFVDADDEVRLARARERGWSDEEFAAREAAQMPMTEKRASATHVFSSHRKEALRQEVDHWWRRSVARR